LPSANPYRKRWKTWDASLLALGYSPEWIEKRLEDGVLAFEPSAIPERASRPAVHGRSTFLTIEPVCR